MIITITFNPAVDTTARVDKVIPGALNRLSGVRQDTAGKGINVSKTLKALGAKSLALGFLGGAAGEFIQESLNEQKIENDFILIEGQTRTNLKILDRAMQLTEFNQPGPSVNQKQVDQLIELLFDHVHQTSEKKEPCSVVLSGNVSPGVSSSIYQELILALQKEKIPVILDADGPLLQQGIQAHPCAVKPNKAELAALFDLPESELTIDKTTNLAKSLLCEETKLVVVSMGIEGALFVSHEQTLFLPALKIDYRSAVGAGDAMTAALAYGLEQKMPFDHLCRYALAVSAAACLSAGTKPADLETVNALMKQLNGRCSS